MKKKDKAVNLVVAKVKAVSVGDLDEYLTELATATAENASEKATMSMREFAWEIDKQSALTTLAALKTRLVTADKWAEMDKSGQAKKIYAEYNTLQKHVEAGKYLNGIFIPALGPSHPSILRIAEAKAVIEQGLKEANRNVNQAIEQQVAYCVQEGYITKAPNVHTTSK